MVVALLFVACDSQSPAVPVPAAKTITESASSVVERTTNVSSSRAASPSRSPSSPPLPPSMAAPMPRRDLASSHPATAVSTPAHTATSSPTPQPTLATFHMERDREALIAFFHATDGPSWTHKRHWLSAAPFATWYGSGADADGRVRALKLSQNRLRGERSPKLGNLTNLVELNLDGNQFTGQLTEEIGDLKRLVRLSANGSQQSGPFPPELGSQKESLVPRARLEPNRRVDSPRNRRVEQPAGTTPVPETAGGSAPRRNRQPRHPHKSRALGQSNQWAGTGVTQSPQEPAILESG